MAKIALISCVNKKRPYKAKAKELYVSSLFKFNLKYAESFADRIYILSAKHGLLGLNEEVEPYDLTLNTMSSKEIKAWAKAVIEKLSKVSDLEKDDFTFLAGEKYRKYLLPHIKNYKIPLKGLGIGKQLQYLKREIK